MLDSLEIEQRILSLLDEFISDNICAIMNTVFAPPPGWDHIAIYQDALRSLLAKGHIMISIERDEVLEYRALPQPDALAIVDHIPDELIPRDGGRSWAWKSAKKLTAPHDVLRPEIVATDAGLIEAKRIVQERGERWWK